MVIILSCRGILHCALNKEVNERKPIHLNDSK
jgi:hypothetical protein